MRQVRTNLGPNWQKIARGDLLTFGEESEMDFDVVFVDFLAEEKYFLASLHWAGVVAVVEDLKVWVTFLVADDVGNNGGQGKETLVSFQKYLKTFRTL